jgi:hypothetical protein
MKLWSHFLGFIATIIIIHFIFIDIQHLLHPNSSTAEVRPDKVSKLKVRPKISVTEDQSVLVDHINQTLIQLRSDLQHVKSLRNVKAGLESVLMNEPTQISSSVAESTSKTPDNEVRRVPSLNKKAVIFTMDCITSYEENSRNGGAAGELIIRHALEDAFKHFNIPLHIVRSDNEFSKCEMREYDIILLDSWTWAAKGKMFLVDVSIVMVFLFLGWVPKPNIKDYEDRIFILDFFGSSKLRGSLSINVKNQILTAFKSPWNNYLGYYIPEDRLNVPIASLQKLQQGVIWGKDPKYFTGHETMLINAANKVKLLSTASQTLFSHRNIKWLGHQSNQEWLSLLASSKFLLGMGHPLLGPSAVDAVSLGCMFINAKYKTPQLEAKYTSQHPWIAEIAPQYVCTYEEDNVFQLLACVDKAMKSDLKPFIPAELQKKKYFERVKLIFDIS